MAEPTERDRERARAFTARIVALDWGQEAEDALAQLLADERERAAQIAENSVPGFISRFPDLKHDVEVATARALLIAVRIRQGDAT